MKTAVNRLVILGAGGFGRVVADVASQLKQYESVVFLDDGNGADIVGKCSDYAAFLDENTELYPAFGNNALRLDWLERLLQSGARVPTLVHPTAYVSPTAKIGAGTVILPKAVVNSYTAIGQGCIINVGAIIDHNCTVGAGAHICLGTIVKADNHIPSCLKIEAGEVVRNGTYL